MTIALKSTSLTGEGRSAVVMITVTRPLGVNVMTPRGLAPNKSNSSPVSSVLTRFEISFHVPKRPVALAIDAVMLRAFLLRKETMLAERPTAGRHPDRLSVAVVRLPAADSRRGIR